MKTTISNQLDTQVQISGEWNSENNEMAFKAYHELADRPVVETDLMTEFRSNLKILAEMQERTSFVMNEVRYLLKMNG